MALQGRLLIGVLEDDVAQSELYNKWLIDAGMETKISTTGNEFIQLAKEAPLDLAIVDWFLPDTIGLDVIRSLRRGGLHRGPIIVSTVLNDEEMIVKALDEGADDYLIKPVTQGLLLARIRAATRRLNPSRDSRILQCRNITIDVSAAKVWRDGKEIDVSSKDFQLICCFFRNIGRLLSREFLLRTIWGINAEIDTRTVDVHVSRIRRLLRLQAGSGLRLVAIYSRGYRLEVTN